MKQPLATGEVIEQEALEQLAEGEIDFRHRVCVIEATPGRSLERVGEVEHRVGGRIGGHARKGVLRGGQPSLGEPEVGPRLLDHRQGGVGVLVCALGDVASPLGVPGTWVRTRGTASLVG